MPSLKRLFGSPFGSHKKNKDHGRAVRKRKGKAISSHPSSPITLSSSGSAETVDHDQHHRHVSKEESSSTRTRATLKIDPHAQGDDDDDDDFRSTILASTSTDAWSKDEVIDDDHASTFNADHDDDEDDFQTTVLSSVSRDSNNGEVSNDAVDDNDPMVIVDGDDDDFRTTILATTSREVNADGASDVSVNSLDEEEDFQTTILVSDEVNDDDNANGINRGNEVDNDDDDFRTTVLPTTSQDTRSEEGVNGDGSDVNSFRSLDTDDDEYDDLLAVDDDYRTTIMACRSAGKTVTSSKESSTDGDGDGDGDGVASALLLDYLLMDEALSKSKPKDSILQDNYNVDDLCSDLDGEDDTDSGSPIDSVVFGEKEDISNHEGGNSTKKKDSTSHLLPLLSPVSGDDDCERLVDFDDFRSTISGLTEATNYISFHNGHKKIVPPSPSNRIIVPPSPSNSTSDASTKKLETFLKTETEAIRQLLSTVESGEEESTVVEESYRGANEAERMAKEMEREMEMLLQGNRNILHSVSIDESMREEDTSQNSFDINSPIVDATQTTVYHPPQETPDSDEFVADIRGVIHPTSDSSVDFCNSNEDRYLLMSPHSPRSHRSSRSIHSSSSSRRDLFLKRPSLYKLKQKQSRKKLNRKKLRRLLRYTLRYLILTIVVCSMVFVANWQWNFSDQDVSSAAKSTVSQLKYHTHIDPKKKEEVMVLVKKTSLATKSYMETQMIRFTDKANSATMVIIENLPTTELESAKQHILENLRWTSSVILRETKHYAPIIAQQSRHHLIRGVQATNTFLLEQLDTHVWTPDLKLRVTERIQATHQYIQDRLEYAFTDRAVREQQLQEEARLQRLMEAAAAAAAREAAEKQEQLWTQTMFAGACAFIGSVATNYIWASF